jgi:hypothetical protein
MSVYAQKENKKPVIDSLGNTYDKDAPQHTDNSTDILKKFEQF